MSVMSIIRYQDECDEYQLILFYGMMEGLRLLQDDDLLFVELRCCLPVPIFNHKKRNRQPLISLPQKNEASGFIPEGFELSPLATGDSGRTFLANNGRNKLDSRSSEKKNMWFEEENSFSSSNKDCPSVSKRYGQLQMSHTQDHTLQLQPPVQLTRSQYCFTASSASKETTPSYVFKNTKAHKDDVFADMPEEEMVQAVPLYHMTVKEKNNTLRILTVSIESMVHWSDYADRTPLLFELFAMLDSAVTSGSYGSKSFILRDGKHHVQCVFYEIDRELQRLIRGRVHRVMGNYDKKRNLLKCVSVRPASAAEQQTFPEWVSAANREMEKYVKTMTEM
ncbi:spermatogenesis-associated protein 22 [Gastrophryne carolinensis]